MDFFAEASAKTGENVKNTFINVGKMLYQKHIKKILSTKKDQMKKGKKLQKKRVNSENSVPTGPESK